MDRDLESVEDVRVFRVLGMTSVDEVRHLENVYMLGVVVLQC